MGFDHVVTVRFQHVDRAGIAFFAQVFDYCHAAYEEMLAAAELPLHVIFDHSRWGMPLVHAEADYASPMRMGDRLRVTLEVERLGGKSVTLRYQVVGDEDGVHRATVRLVHVFVDLDAFGSRPVPEEVRAGFERLGLLEEAADGGA